MKKQVYKIDKHGYLQEIFVKYFEENEDYPIEFIDNEFGRVVVIDPPNGLYRAKWIGSEWVEGLSQEEIDEINNQPRKLTETEKLQAELANTNAMLLEFMETMLI